MFNLEAFDGGESMRNRVERSKPGEADEILAKVIRKGDRGASLSPTERAILDHHLPDILKEEDQDTPYRPWGDSRGH